MVTARIIAKTGGKMRNEQFYFRKASVYCLQQTINKFRSTMQVLHPVQSDDRPATVNEESDDRKEPVTKPLVSKKKIIRKKNKSKSKSSELAEHSTMVQVSTTPTMAPFGIFESETQKCQRLQHYLRKDIENFYKTEISTRESEILDSLLNYNLVQLTDIYHKDLSNFWREKQCSLSEIANYLQIVEQVSQHNNRFTIIFDEGSKKYFICFQKFTEVQFSEISYVQISLLQKREEFLLLLKKSYQILQKKHGATNALPHKMSELSIQIAFLFKSLYDETKKLKGHVDCLKRNIQSITSMPSIAEDPETTENRYIAYLIRKLVINSFKDDQIDFLNFFKNNQLVEHNYGPPQATITQQKQFEEFMRKKKNKKGKKGKYALHTACLGCCSSYYEQYNPFNYCQQCYVRFHKFCYTGFPAKEQLVYVNQREEKDLLCESCFNKKNSPNFKQRGNQCDYCGLKGLLSVPAGPYKRIHIQCMLVNDLWTVSNSKLQFKSKTENKVPYSDTLRCTYCNSGYGYLHFCSLCQKYVHVSCAYFAGWKIQAQMGEFKQHFELRLQCCGGVSLAENQKRRKFATNYKKQAYSF